MTIIQIIKSRYLHIKTLFIFVQPRDSQYGDVTLIGQVDLITLKGNYKYSGIFCLCEKSLTFYALFEVSETKERGRREIFCTMTSPISIDLRRYYSKLPRLF